ncbi:hypothetical protein Sste5346_003623 [Sporothrix stenoceras]|uniref:Xylanolytic transcriptional activator regulatory domain-containing protein n=1 Tax=Sporothrix stenoceras TaxID=5173 RepID=A0ABR3ZD62_9PEZI
MGPKSTSSGAVGADNITAPGLSTDLTLSLGLHPTTHFKYIGPGSLHEDLLLDFIEPAFRPHSDQDASKFCRVAEGVTFLARADATVHTNASNTSADGANVADVERLVHPHGPALIDLYFRIVHPSYSILHKDILLEQYGRKERGTVVSAPLLAALYLLALDWWEYDVALGQGVGRGSTSSRDGNTKPDGEALARIASQSLSAAIQRPKLSTVQACLLLLQRGATTGNDSWVLTSQLVAVAEELGLHVDCQNWSIPIWEKGLRRRLAWATFMQDKWSSLIYGRPSHVQAEHWRIPQLDLSDFVEDNSQTMETDDDVLKGRLLFIHLARLTEVMAEALATFYSHDPQHHDVFSSSDGMQTVALVKPVALRLRAWATALPSCLRMEAVRPHKLCSNGYLHLAYFVTEIMVYRCIVRSLARKPLLDAETTMASAGPPLALVNLCREAAKTRLLHVMRFVEALRPEHLQAFWWFASAKSLAYIRTYVSMLWATSPNNAEAEMYRQKLDEFRWSLRVRARGVAFVTAALRDMGESLEDIDMSSPPFERRAQAEVKKRELRGGVRSYTADTSTGRAKGSTGGADTPVVREQERTPTSSMQNFGTDLDHLDDFDDMVLQTTPEFLADFGVDASHTFFADINSLHLSMDGD